MVAQSAARLPELRAASLLARLVHEHDQQRGVGSSHSHAVQHRRDHAGGLREFVPTHGRLRRHRRLRPHVHDEPLVRLPRSSPGRRARRDGAAHAVVQVLVHGPATGRHHRPALLLVREPPPALPRRRVPRRAGVPERRVRQRREHRCLAQGARPRLHRRLAHREGALRFHRVALGRLLPEDGGRTAHDHRVGRRPGARAARVVHPRPVVLRHRAQHPARQLRCDARSVLHEGQERRHRSRHVQPVQAAVRRHLAAVHIARRPGRDAPRACTALPPPRGDPAGRAVAAHDHRPGAHGYPARSVAPGRPERHECRRLLVPRPGERRVLVGEGCANGLADGAADARHPRPVRPLGIGLLQTVQAHRRPHGRRPRGGAVAGAATRSDARVRAADRRRHVHVSQRRGDAVDRAVVPTGKGERTAPHLAGHARRERDRVHHAPEERTAVGHAVAGRRRLLDRQREPAAGRRNTVPCR